MLQELKRLLCLYYNKLYSFILQQPAGSLQVTGVLGLAAVVIAYNFFKRNDAPSSDAGQRRQAPTHHALTGVSAAAGRLAAGGSSSSTKAGSNSSKQADQAGLDPVRSKLSGVRKVTISSLGAMTEEWYTTELQEGATLRNEAVDVVKEICSCADTYIITQVQDDVGQAVLTGSLEAAGLIGSRKGQLQPHHVLFCTTLEGKVSIVRQLEPDLHIDGSAKTIDDLKRFMPQLLHIPAPGTSAAGQGSSNVVSSGSLKEYFYGSS